MNRGEERASAPEAKKTVALCCGRRNDRESIYSREVLQDRCARRYGTITLQEEAVLCQQIHALRATEESHVVSKRRDWRPLAGCSNKSQQWVLSDGHDLVEHLNGEAGFALVPFFDQCVKPCAKGYWGWQKGIGLIFVSARSDLIFIASACVAR
jgi:hypothetical protein